MNTPTGSPSFRARNAHLFVVQRPSASELNEAELQSKIAARLRSLGARCYHVWHRTDQPTTCAVGTPDFVGWIDGTPFAFEVKVRGGKLSFEQVAHIHHAERAGAVTWVVRSMDDLEDAIKTINALRK